MAVVITVAQQKGGAGKTMLAANLAVALAPGKGWRCSTPIRRRASRTGSASRAERNKAGAALTFHRGRRLERMSNRARPHPPARMTSW